MDNKEFSQNIKLRIYKWTVRLVKYLRILSKNKEVVVRVVVDQVMRSGTSVGANYVEAIGSPSIKDFRNFISYSLKSCNETKYWLALIRDSELDKQNEELNFLLKEGVEISNILGKSISTMYKK